MNKVILVGRLATDPVVTTTSTGIKRAVFTVATDGFTKDAESDFHKVTVWRQSAEFVEKYVKKADKVLIEGSNKSGKYTDKEGKTVYTYEVVADRVESLTPKASTPTSQPAHEAPQKPQNTAPAIDWDL